VEVTPVTTGIATDANLQFSVYPNPAGSFVRLDIPDNTKGVKNIAITELTGKIVARHDFDNLQYQSSFQINFPDLKKGMYLISVETIGGKTTRKFIVVLD